MQALGTDPTLAGSCIVVVGSRQGKKECDPGLHSCQTDFGPAVLCRPGQSIGREFPGSFPKTAASSCCGLLRLATSLFNATVARLPLRERSLSWEKTGWDQRTGGAARSARALLKFCAACSSGRDARCRCAACWPGKSF